MNFHAAVHWHPWGNIFSLSDSSFSPSLWATILIETSLLQFSCQDSYQLLEWGNSMINSKIMLSFITLLCIMHVIFLFHLNSSQNHSSPHSKFDVGSFGHPPCPVITRHFTKLQNWKVCFSLYISLSLHLQRAVTLSNMAAVALDRLTMLPRLTGHESSSLIVFSVPFLFAGEWNRTKWLKFLPRFLWNSRD